MLNIRSMQDADGDAVLDIYREGIATGHATFEAEPPDWKAFSSAKLEKPRLVAESETGALVGWAALSPVSGRCVYGGIGEVTIHVSTSARGQGIGKRLLQSLIAGSEEEGLWTLQAGIFVENTGSIALHERCGFNRVGIRKGMGRMGYGPMAGRWRDVLLMERRSEVVGID